MRLVCIQFFLRLWGLWEGVINIPPPPKPPFDIETFEPIIPPQRAIKEWVPDDEPPDLWDHQGEWASRPPTSAEEPADWYDQSLPLKFVEIPLGDGRILIPFFD
jgi:hypothetical protein